MSSFCRTNTAEQSSDARNTQSHNNAKDVHLVNVVHVLGVARLIEDQLLYVFACHQPCDTCGDCPSKLVYSCRKLLLLFIIEL